MKKLTLIVLVILIFIQLQSPTSARYMQSIDLKGGSVFSKEDVIIPPEPTQTPQPTPSPTETPAPTETPKPTPVPTPPGTEYYPGTDLEIQDSPWPKPEDYGDNPWQAIVVPPSGIFIYEGEYYIVTVEYGYNKDQAGTGPGGDAFNWHKVQKLTGRILTRADFILPGEGIDNITRGDLYHDVENNDYYVFSTGGNWANPPDIKPELWYKIPR